MILSHLQGNIEITKYPNLKTLQFLLNGAINLSCLTEGWNGATDVNCMSLQSNKHHVEFDNEVNYSCTLRSEQDPSETDKLYNRHMTQTVIK